VLIKALRDDMMNGKGKAREMHDRFGNDESLEDWLADNEGNGTWGGERGGERGKPGRDGKDFGKGKGWKIG